MEETPADKDPGESSAWQTGRGRRSRPLALIIYILSLVLMLVVAGITIWPEIELLFFDRPLIVEERLTTLYCPPAVTLEEDGAITATFTNNRDRNERFRARARMSFLSAVVADEIDRWVELEPGESTVVRWSLEPESAAFGRVILARVHVARRGSIPPQQRGCGVLVLDLPRFTGAQYVHGMAAAGLLALAASGFFWLAGRQPAHVWQAATTRRLALLAATVAGAMFAGLLNQWALGGLLLILSLLLVLSFIQH